MLRVCHRGVNDSNQCIWLQVDSELSLLILPLASPSQSSLAVINSPLEINNAKPVSVLKSKLNFVLLSFAFGT